MLDARLWGQRTWNFWCNDSPWSMTKSPYMCLWSDTCPWSTGSCSSLMHQWQLCLSCSVMARPQYLPSAHLWSLGPMYSSRSPPHLPSINKVIKIFYLTQKKAVEEEQKNKDMRQVENRSSKLAVISPSLWMITLNVNGWNAPVKSYELSGWIKKKQDPNICCLQKIHIRFKDTHRKSKGWEKI